MKRRIYIQDWLVFKPYDKFTSVDTYYLEVANKVKKAILNIPYSKAILAEFNDSEINILSCYLTAHFEDVISETNIWSSFIKLHSKMYNKTLPFYEVDENYYLDEINIQDVNFLTWYFINKAQEDNYYEPFEYFILDIAKVAMEVFEKEWENAPVNELLVSFFTVKRGADELVEIRRILSGLLIVSYLFYPDKGVNNLKLIDELTKIENNPSLIDAMSLDHIEEVLFNENTCLLGLSGKDWFTQILNNSLDLSSLSRKIRGIFACIGEENDYLIFKHIASNKEFSVIKKSFKNSTIHEYYFMGIISWKNEWYFTGSYFDMDYDDIDFEKERQNLESLKEVEFLNTDEENYKKEKSLKKKLDLFKKYNGGYQIAFMPANRVNQFIEDYVSFYNSSVSKLKSSDLLDNEKLNETALLNEYADEIALNNEDIATIFFNQKNGIEIVFDGYSAFPMVNNLYYNAELEKSHFSSILIEEEYSPELFLFCIENCEKSLVFYNSEDAKHIKENTDFLLRFFKYRQYPSVN